jgi:hypothetical protein
VPYRKLSTFNGALLLAFFYKYNTEKCVGRSGSEGCLPDLQTQFSQYCSNVILNKKVALVGNVSDCGSTQTQAMLTTVEFKKNCAAIDWN